MSTWRVARSAWREKSKLIKAEGMHLRLPLSLPFTSPRATSHAPQGLSVLLNPIVRCFMRNIHVMNM